MYPTKQLPLPLRRPESGALVTPRLQNTTAPHIWVRTKSFQDAMDEYGLQKHFKHTLDSPINCCVADLKQVVAWLAPAMAGGSGAAATRTDVGEGGRSYLLAESDLKPLAAKVNIFANSSVLMLRSAWCTGLGVKHM